MNPEKRLLVVLKYLAVELLILLLCAVIRMLCPKRCCIIYRNRSLYNLKLLRSRNCLNCLLCSILLLNLLSLSFLNDCLHNLICVKKLILVDCLVLLTCVRILNIYLNRHEGTILLYNFLCTVLIGELIALLRQIESNLSTSCCLSTLFHIILCTAIALPVNRLSSLLI